MMRRLTSRTCAIYLYVLFTKKQRQRQRQSLMMQRLNSWYGSCAVDLRIINKESNQIIIN